MKTIEKNANQLQKQTIIYSKITVMLPTLSILGAVFLWGSSYSTMKFVLTDLHPMAVMFLRLLVAFVFLLPFIGRLVPKAYQRGDWRILVPMVLFQPCLYFLFESNALRFTSSSQAGIIAASLPVIMAVAAWFFLSESIHSKTLIGVILSILGVVGLTLFQADNTRASNPMLGNILEFGAILCAAINMIMIKSLSSRYNTWTLTGMQVVAGLVFFLPGVRHLTTTDPSVWNIKTIIILLYLGSFVSLIAFGLYNWGISKVRASRAAIFINLVPVIAVVLGWLFLKEALNQQQILSTILIIFGVFLSNKK